MAQEVRRVPVKAVEQFMRRMGGCPVIFKGITIMWEDLFVAEQRRYAIAVLNGS